MKKGFSLFELLVVIALIGILSGILYPSYAIHIKKVNREQAETTLLEIANRLEELHSVTGTYENSDINALIPTSAHTLPFRFIISQVTNDTYFLKAIPVGTQLDDPSSHCTTLTLASDGSHCW